MKIGIMGAMIEEVSSIRDRMKNVITVDHGNRQFYLGKINDQDVVLVFSRWGKVAAAATVTALITEFKINQLIFTGVAGGVATELNIGDVVISEKLYQYDMDSRPLLPQYEIPLTGKTFLHADSALIKKAHAATESLFDAVRQKISVKTLREFNIVNPKCMMGLIGTGDQFVASVEHAGEILEGHPKTLCVEMEGASVAQVCDDYRIPFVVIRTISDKANHTSEIDCPKFFKEIATHYSEHMVCHMLGSAVMVE